MKASCTKGHPYPESLRPGRRDCAICHRTAQKRRQRAAGVQPHTSGYVTTGTCRRGHRIEGDNLKSKGPGRNPDCRKCHQINSLSKDPAVRDYAAILIEDPCSYCGGPGGCVDHIIPRAHGGPDDPNNLTATCFSCNARKRTRPMLAFLLDQRLAA